MKKISFLALIFFSFFYACTPIQYSSSSRNQQPAVVVNNNNDQVTDQTFYDDLAPDGRWINDAELGYVWSPNVSSDFRPYYTNGHWTYTDYGWTWVSDYNWGWATFHYGRWKFDNAYGWVWAPGHEWGPAWVQWRKTPDAYGWAPLEPGISIEVGYSSGYHIPDNRWAFVPQQHFGDKDFHRYVPPVQQNNVYINKSTVINNNITINNNHNTYNDNRKYYAGPEINEVRNVTKQNIQVRNIQNNNRPGATMENNNAVNIYRPMVRENKDNQATRPAPRNVVNQPQTTPAFHQPNYRNDAPTNQNRPIPQSGNQNQFSRPTNNQNTSNQQGNTQNINQPTNPNQQGEPRKWNNNNLPTTAPVTQPTIPQKQQEKPELNPSENLNRKPGDVMPNNPNGAQRQNRNDQPKNEQPVLGTQQQPPQPNKNNNTPTQHQNPTYQQRQPATSTNPSTAPQDNTRRYQPLNRTPQNQPTQNLPQHNQPQQTPQNQHRYTPNPNSGTNPAQNNKPPVKLQPITKPVEPPKSSTQPVTPKKEENPAQ